MKYFFVKPLLIIFLLTFLRGTVFAQTSSVTPSDLMSVNPYSEGLSGVVVENTLTVAGNQFYRLFALAWREKPESEKYSLSVVESRGRQRVSQVTVYYANKSLYSAFLPTKISALQTLVDQSLDAVSSRLLALDLEASESDPDMASNDM
jgi:curli production assembly/transport component CsgE